MIIAKVFIKGELYPVEVIDAITTGDGRKLAVVQAFQGEPFCSWTHGGWAYDNTLNVPAALLQEVEIIHDDAEADTFADAPFLVAVPEVVAL